MTKFVCVFALVLVASAARAQTADEARCLASGGTVWDGAKSSPPRCTCPRGKVNAINAGGACDRQSPNCDKCVLAGTYGNVRVVEREKLVPPSCEALCKAQGEQLAHWVKDAAKGSQCEPADPGAYLAGECAVAPKPVKEPTPEERCQAGCEATSGGAAYWDAGAGTDERCQPSDPQKFVPGPCSIAPKPVDTNPQLICATMCVDSGGKLTDTGCQCPDGRIAKGRCLCQPVEKQRPPVFHIGGELRVLGLAVSRGSDGLYVPVGVAPSLVLRFDPWGPGKDLVVGVGPLVTGNGGETEDTPTGVALMAGFYAGGSGLSIFGLEVDTNWYSIDRTGEAYAFSLGARAPVMRWQWKLRRGECHAGGGIGGAYLLPEEMAAFIWGISGGCTTP